MFSPKASKNNLKPKPILGNPPKLPPENRCINREVVLALGELSSESKKSGTELTQSICRGSGWFEHEPEPDSLPTILLHHVAPEHLEKEHILSEKQNMVIT